MKNLIIPSCSALLVSASLSLTVLAQNRTSRIGSFVAAEVPTSGIVRVVTRDGQRFLEFDRAFNTSDRGPDLHVLLDPAAKPPQSYQNLNRYLNLGKLHNFNGTQRYPIPKDIDLTNYKSVVIWCRMANATFGYAPLVSSRANQR